MYPKSLKSYGDLSRIKRNKNLQNLYRCNGDVIKSKIIPIPSPIAITEANLKPGFL